MDTTEQDNELSYEDELVTSAEDAIEKQREIIRKSLDAIGSDVAMAMRDAGLNFPIGITVANSGASLVGVLCPVDPPEIEWACGVRIVCKIVGEKLGGIRLRGRALPCALVNSQMGVAEVCL